MQDLTNKFGLQVELKDFSQKQYAEFQPQVLRATRDYYFEFGSDGGLTANAAVRSVTIKAAISAGFLTGITPEQVDELKPYVATWLSEKIEAHVREVTNPPPDPN